jgi:sRNA-binding carbon storage regulator CsrA
MLVLKRKPGSALVLQTPGRPDVTIYVGDNHQLAIDAPQCVSIKRKERLATPSESFSQPITEDAAA